MPTLMLTGATGFLGSHLLKGLLVNTDYDIVVLKRSTSDIFRIYTELENKRVKSFDSDFVPLRDIFSQSPADIIIHAATNYGRDNKNITEVVEANLILPLRLLQFGMEYGLKTFVNTDTILDKNISHYSMSKKQFLDWLFAYSNRIKCLNLRLEHFYGPHDNKTKFVTFIVRSLLSDVPFIDLTAGEQKRHFIDVNDVVDAFVCVLKNADIIENGFNTFDISTEKSISVRDFVMLTKRLSGNTTTKLNFGIVSYRHGEAMDVQTDIRPLCALGWQPKIPLDVGLASMIRQERNKFT